MPIWNLPALGLALVAAEAPSEPAKSAQIAAQESRVALTERSDSREKKTDCEGCGGKVLPRPAPTLQPLPTFAPPAGVKPFPKTQDAIRTVSAKSPDDLVEIPTGNAKSQAAGPAANTTTTATAAQQSQGDSNRRSPWWKRMNPFARRNNRGNDSQRDQQDRSNNGKQANANGQPQTQQLPPPGPLDPPTRPQPQPTTAAQPPKMLPKVTAAPLPPPPVTEAATASTATPNALQLAPVPTVPLKPAPTPPAKKPASAPKKPAPAPAPAPKSGLVDIPTDGGELILPPSVQQMSFDSEEPTLKPKSLVRDVSAWTAVKPTETKPKSDK